MRDSKVRAPFNQTPSERLEWYTWEVEPSGCWLLPLYRDRDGYTTISYQKRKWLAHRLAYTAWVGLVPEGLYVLHTCDNPPCINPEHLYAGSQVDNMQDVLVRSRREWDKGSLNAQAKLTESQAREIYSHPGVQREIASQYGVSPTTVSNIKSHKTWRHI